MAEDELYRALTRLIGVVGTGTTVTQLLSAVRQPVVKLDPSAVGAGVRQALLNTLPTLLPLFFKRVLDGKAFSASVRFEDVPSDNSRDVLIENVGDKTAYIAAIEVASFAQVHIDIYEDNTISARGTQVSPRPLNLGIENSPSLSIEYGGTYTPGRLVHQSICPGGSHIRAVGGLVEVGETVVVPPGKNVLVRVTNASASSTDFSVRVLWWEE